MNAYTIRQNPRLEEPSFSRAEIFLRSLAARGRLPNGEPLWTTWRSDDGPCLGEREWRWLAEASGVPADELRAAARRLFGPLRRRVVEKERLTVLPPRDEARRRLRSVERQD